MPQRRASVILIACSGTLWQLKTVNRWLAPHRKRTATPERQC